MKQLILTLFVFAIIYLAYFIFVICSKSKMEEFGNNVYLKFLIKKFSLNIKKMDLKKMAHIIALCNSFIISFTFFITEIADNFIYKMILGCASLFLLELIVYLLVGKILSKKYR